MPSKSARKSLKNELILKIVYFYGHIFGLGFFNIVDNFRVKFCPRKFHFSVVYRLVCLFGHGLIAYSSIFRQYYVELTVYNLTIYTAVTLAVVSFTLTLIAVQIQHRNGLITIINVTRETFKKLSSITGNGNVFGPEFWLIALSRVVYNLHSLVASIQNYALSPSSIIGIESQYVLVSVYALGVVSCLGVSVAFDFLIFGYLIASGMYYKVSNHMMAFMGRVEKVHREGRNLSKLRLMVIVGELAEHLDQCAMLYERMFKISTKFHAMFAAPVSLIFCFYIVLVISTIQTAFAILMVGEKIPWNLCLLIGFNILDCVSFIMLVDLVQRRSRIPQKLKWECLLTNVDARWDESVELFLNQLKLQTLTFDVFGMFAINNELCLMIFSIVVTYLTIVIQFGMQVGV